MRRNREGVPSSAVLRRSQLVRRARARTVYDVRVARPRVRSKMSTRRSLTWLGLLLALLVIGAIALRLGTNEDQNEALESSQPLALAHERAAEPAPAELDGDRSAVEPMVPTPTTTEPLIASASAASPWTVAIFGRCAFGEQPAADAPVTLRVHDSRGARETVHLETRTASDGRFRFEVEHMAANAYYLSCGGGELSSWGTYPIVHEGVTEIDVGLVQLERGCTLEGRVLSREGEPVAAARVLFMRVFDDAQLAAAPPDDRNRMGGAPSNEDGRFESVGLAAAVWEVEVTGLGLLGTVPQQVDARAGGRIELELVVELVAPVTGRVVLPDGSPIEGVLVTCDGAESGEEASFERKSRADGTFELVTRPGWGSREPLRVRLSRAVDAYVAEPVPAEWGQHVLLVAQPTPRVRVRVVDAASGELIRGWACRVNAAPHVGGPLREAPTGMIEIARPTAAPFWLHVIPRTEHRALGPIELPQPEQAELDLEIALEQRCVVQVDARTHAGEPVAHASVELVSVSPTADANALRMVAPVDRQSFFTQSDGWLWQRGTTDVSGRVELALPDVADALVLRLTGERGEQVQQTLERGARRAQLVLPPGATLELRFRGTWPVAMAHWLRCASRPELERVPRDRVLEAQRLAPVLLTGLPAGTWEVCAGHAGRQYALATVELAVGVEQLLELDADELLTPARSVTVRRANGAALEGELVLEHAEHAGWVELFRGLIEGGRIALPVLPNGRYRARLARDGSERLLDELEWRELEWRFD